MPTVVTFGEAMIRLSPPNFARLEQTRSLDVIVGGSELNIAVALSRLGTAASWVSALPNNPLGRLVVNKGRELGVDMSPVQFTAGRCGLYFVEFGAKPRGSSVLYDRADSAVSRIKPGQFDWAKIFAGAKVFHTGGITPALSDSAAEVCSESMTAARKAGLKIGFDVNYRAKLWSQDKAHAVVHGLSDRIDYLFTSEEDTKRVYKIEGKDYEEVCRKLVDKYGFKVVAITLREDLSVWKNNWTAIAFDGKQFYRTHKYELEIVDRVGAGDSFTGGFLHGLLTGDVQKAVDWGTAISALKHSMPGDFNFATAEEVEALVKGGGSLRIAR